MLWWCKLKNTIGIIGGDLRQRYLAEVLEMPIVFFANEKIDEKETVTKSNCLSDLFLSSEIILVPIPFSKNQTHVYAKHYVDPISIDAFISNLSKNHIIIGGPFSGEVIQKIKNQGAKFIDITSLETFKEKNAIPTSEGVIAEIVHRLTSTIYKSQGLILGYGYCGKRLTNSLKALGAELDLYTENSIEKKTALKNGLTIIKPFHQSKHYDYIINTIPKVILHTEDILNNTTLFIDITEAYQMDHDCFVKMRGIPGSLSPKSAGAIIGELVNDLVINIMGEDDEWSLKI